MLAVGRASEVLAVEAHSGRPVGSIRRSTRRPSVDLPQPDSPTRPASRRPRSGSSTPSTARTCRRAGRRRRAAPRKCLARPSTSSSALTSPDRLRSRALRGGSAAGVPGATLERRVSVAAGGLDQGQRAAKRQRRRAAGHVGGTRPSIEAERGASRRGAGSSPAGRACRDAAGGRTGRRPARSTIWPAYMTATSSAISATTPRSWVIRMMAVPVWRLQLAHQVEDLRLDGDVERGGRLVGDQELRDRRPAPWRSSRAGACRPTACADSRRRAARARGCARVRASRWRARAPRRAERRGGADRLGDLVADRVGRIERGHRLLEDHGEPAPRMSRMVSAVEVEKIAAVEADLALHGGVLRRSRPMMAERRHALAAAGSRRPVPACGLAPATGRCRRRRAPCRRRWRRNGKLAQFEQSAH